VIGIGLDFNIVSKPGGSLRAIGNPCWRDALNSVPLPEDAPRVSKDFFVFFGTRAYYPASIQADGPVSASDESAAAMAECVFPAAAMQPSPHHRIQCERRNFPYGL
jgi:hypothetical protein